MVQFPAVHVLGLAAAAALQYRTGAIDAEQVLVPLAAALGLAVLVERAVELGKNVIDLIPTAAPVRVLHGDAALLAADREMVERYDTAEERAREEEGIAGRAASVAYLRELERKLATTGEASDLEREVRNEAQALRAKLREEEASGEIEEGIAPSRLLVQPATDPDDGTTLRAFMLQTLAVVGGIVAARLSGLELFSALSQPLNGPSLPVGADYLLTGLLIGGGSTPVHMLIRFVSERRVVPPEPAADDGEKPAAVVASVAEPVAVPRPAMLPAPASGAAPDDDWVEIAYDGGVDVDRLEGVHRRSTNPRRIVYHHTAMHGDSTFEDVVRVIKSRRDKKGRPWITGYNCVVTGDARIHPFCRWDRYGNHAVGHNFDSLGIAINGNFETDPSVPFSNPDGRFGRQRPTPAQLESAARVVAFWCLVYNIPVDFEDHILPHHAVSTKTCPGNNFPYDDFERQVAYFHGAWSVSPRVRSRVLAFRRKPYVLVQEIDDARVGAPLVAAGGENGGQG